MVASETDYLVIGAGSAGCALARRISDRGYTVALVEAGPLLSQRDERRPNAYNCDLSGHLDWRLLGSLPDGRITDLPRGRVVGGSSVINTCVSLRPDAKSIDTWNAIADGWGWEDLQLYFRRLERDLDFPESPYHGSSGPTPIVRWNVDELESPSVAFLEAALAAGHPFVHDLNAPTEVTGVGMAPMNRIGKMRISADVAYLSQSRETLTLHPDVQIEQIDFVGNKAIGASGRDAKGERKLFRSLHTIVSCGAYATPSLLFRSGLGPADMLMDAGHVVVADLQGVGRGLIDHSQVHFVLRTPHLSRESPALQVLVRATSGIGGVDNDVQFCALNRVDNLRYAGMDDNGSSLVMLCALIESAAPEGWICNLLPSPASRPAVTVDYLARREDRARFAWAVQHLLGLIQEPAMRSMEWYDQVNGSELSEGVLEEVIRTRVKTAHHPMGTARMGRDRDEYAVVDSRLRVRGTRGLSVADASVIPVSLNANINLTVIALAERHAEDLMCL